MSGWSAATTLRALGRLSGHCRPGEQVSTHAVDGWLAPTHRAHHVRYHPLINRLLIVFRDGVPLLQRNTVLWWLVGCCCVLVGWCCSSVLVLFLAGQ